MSDDLEVRRRRAAYRAAHRGTKEMDIVLGGYAREHLAGMALEEIERFERFLSLPDPLLHQWFAAGTVDGNGSEFAELVADLRSHHGLTEADGGPRTERE